MKKIITVLISVFIFSFGLINLNYVFADNRFDQVVDSNGVFQDTYGAKAIASGVLSDKSLPEIIGGIIKVILGLSGTVALVFIVWGGIDWMTSQGKTDKIKAAKDRMIAAAIGIFIIAVSYAITDFVIKQLTVIAG